MISKDLAGWSGGLGHNVFDQQCPKQQVFIRHTSVLGYYCFFRNLLMANSYPATSISCFISLLCHYCIVYILSTLSKHKIVELVKSVEYPPFPCEVPTFLKATPKYNKTGVNLNVKLLLYLNENHMIISILNTSRIKKYILRNTCN